MSRVFQNDAFTKLLLRYADGRQLCNCNEAYEGLVKAYVVGKGYVMVPGCVHGCSTNKIDAKEEVAERLVGEFLK